MDTCYLLGISSNVYGVANRHNSKYPENNGFGLPLLLFKIESPFILIRNYLLPTN